MSTRIFHLISRAFVPALALTLSGLLVGCGGSDRSPLASSLAEDTAARALASKATTGVVQEDPAHDDYEIPDDGDGTVSDNSNKIAVGQNFQTPDYGDGARKTVFENDNGIPAPEAGADGEEEDGQ